MTDTYSLHNGKYIKDKGTISGIKNNSTEVKYQGSVSIEDANMQFIVATVQYGSKGSSTGIYQRIGELKPNSDKQNEQDGRPDYKAHINVVHRQPHDGGYKTTSKYKNLSVWVNQNKETQEKYLGLEFSSKDFSDTSSAPKQSNAWKSEQETPF